MTTNNQVKAPRPCTIEGVTFDSNNLISILARESDFGIFYFDGRSDADYQTIYTTKLLKAIQAIASAQRPWLKAEWFEFVQGEVVELLYKDGSRCFGKFDGINAFNTCWSDGFIYYEDRHSKENNLETINISLFNAFKPISDSEEEWYALAGVEVYKESTNDTQTNG